MAVERVRLARDGYELWRGCQRQIARYAEDHHHCGHNVDNQPRDEYGRWVKTGDSGSGIVMHSYVGE